jgi:hypothetical protein
MVITKEWLNEILNFKPSLGHLKFDIVDEKENYLILKLSQKDFDLNKSKILFRLEQLKKSGQIKDYKVYPNVVNFYSKSDLLVCIIRIDK